jgi:hypothetical protein
MGAADQRCMVRGSALATARDLVGAVLEWPSLGAAATAFDACGCVRMYPSRTHRSFRSTTTETPVTNWVLSTRLGAEGDEL